MEQHDPPPQYSSSSSSTTTPRDRTGLSIPGLTHLPLSHYRIPNSTVSPDKTTVTVYSKQLCSDPTALETFLREQIALPPRPLVHIKPRLESQDEDSTSRDFNLRLDMLRHISAPPEAQRNWSYVKFPGAAPAQTHGAAPPGEKGNMGGAISGGGGMDDLRFWVRRFCADGTAAKTLTLRRTITNWDTDYLAGRCQHLITSLDLHPLHTPQIVVEFPVQHSTITVNSWNKPTGFLSSVSSFFTEPLSKNYDPINVVWPYATQPRFSGDEGLSRSVRECVLQSEDGWWEEWSPAIKAAMVARRRGFRGWVTYEDRLEALMGGPVTG